MRVYKGLLLFLSLSSLIMISLSLIFKVFFVLRSGSWGGLHHPCCFSTSSPYSAPFGQVIACVPECLQGCLLWGRGVVEGHFAAYTSLCPYPSNTLSGPPVRWPSAQIYLQTYTHNPVLPSFHPV